MKTTLITGINGFIGKHLALYLKSAGYEVMTADRQALENPIHLADALSTVKLDYIFHLAAYGNHSDQKDETETISTNILKTWFLLDATKNHNYKAFINVSSSSVYGVKEEPMREKGSLNGDTLYAATKIAGEALARYQAISKNKPIVNLRPFSAYGPGEAEHRFIPTVIRNMIEEKEFVLDPEVYHDWIYIDDVVHGLLETALNAKKLKGEAINIGTGSQWKNREIVEKLEWIMNKKAIFKVERDLRDYKPKDWVADISKAKSIGWSPKVDLIEGLKETVKYYEHRE